MQKHQNQSKNNTLNPIRRYRHKKTSNNMDIENHSIDISLKCKEDDNIRNCTSLTSKHKSSINISNLSSCNQSQEFTETNLTNNCTEMSNVTPMHLRKHKFKCLYNNINEINQRYNDKEDFYNRTKELHQLRRNYLNYNARFDEEKRYILLDWIMDVCSMIGFKRSTYYLCVVLVDSFMAQIDNVQVNRLQLIGVSCLILAAKNEEIKIPCTQFFSTATDHSCSEEDIKLYQMYILKALGFKIQYPTLETWGNYMTVKWDEFANMENLKLINQVKFPKFRHDSQYDYMLFRQFFLIFDVISLDYYHQFFNEKDLCACLIFLLIGITIKIFTFDLVKTSFANNDFDSKFYSYNSLLLSYFEKEFGIYQEDFVQSLKYVCQFFSINFEYSNPQSNSPAETYEDRIQIQTRNKENLKSIELIYKMRKNSAQ